MLLPLPLLMKKLREHMTPLRPLDLQGSIRHLVYLTCHKLQVTLLHTEVEKKKTQRRKTERGLSPCRGLSRDGSAKTTTPPRWAATSTRTIGRGDHDLRTPPSAVGAATSEHRPWSVVL